MRQGSTLPKSTTLGSENLLSFYLKSQKFLEFAYHKFFLPYKLYLDLRMIAKMYISMQADFTEIKKERRERGERKIDRQIDTHTHTHTHTRTHARIC
jgi:hypothetical protein